MSESIELADPASVCTPVRRGAKRRREIAAVAEQVFFENGFTDTTMQTIAVRAGASKETLYRHFGSKEGLFAEIVASRAQDFLANLDENFERPGSVADVLRSLGRTLLQSMVCSDAISLCRTVVSESPRNPELGRIFFAGGPERVRTRLTEFLTAAATRNELSCSDPTLAARLFLGSVIGSYHLARLVLADPPIPPPSQLEKHVDEAVVMFLRNYGSVSA